MVECPSTSDTTAMSIPVAGLQVPQPLTGGYEDCPARRLGQGPVRKRRCSTVPRMFDLGYTELAFLAILVSGVGFLLLLQRR
jgi:hypothetical protein